MMQLDPWILTQALQTTGLGSSRHSPTAEQGSHAHLDRPSLHSARKRSQLQDLVMCWIDSPANTRYLLRSVISVLMKKAEMLYNHAKHAVSFNQESRDFIKRSARFIALHPNFTPERIRQLIESRHLDQNTVKNAQIHRREDLVQFLSNPGKRWVTAYHKQSPSEQAFLISLLDRRESSPASALQESYERRLQNLGSKGLPFSEELLG